jgi:hypothetical protein
LSGFFLARLLLLTKESTRKNVLAFVRAASGALQSGDLPFVSYSGHGSQITDVSGEEDDKLDETWCLYDGELIDDEVFLELCALPPAAGAGPLRQLPQQQAKEFTNLRLGRDMRDTFNLPWFSTAARSVLGPLMANHRQVASH